MNHCRKLELIPEDEVEIENKNETKSETEVSSLQKRLLIDKPKLVEKPSENEFVEKIDINLIKIAEDIVSRIIDKKFTVSKESIKRKIPLISQLKVESNNKTPNKKLKTNNWVFVRK